jgi:arabinofuranan 3-O-arabinosyltransferase
MAGTTSVSTTASRAEGRRVPRLDLFIAALVAYVPFLLSSPGRVSGDTKQYLYLDPGRLLEQAPYLWDPHVAAGTVTHQNIGYLFPMGPYFWLMQELGVPDWVAQRLWLGSISFAAVAGVLWLLTRLGVSRAGAIAGGVVYLLTPYQLAFTARISVILLPWAALPWLVGLTARALERRGWRDPAMFALVALAAGSINATALTFVGVAPVLWLVVAVFQRRATAAHAAMTAVRIGLLSAGVSIWWATGLVVQGRYGLPVLDVTESLRTVASASTPSDLLRGLGNWFLSGSDRLGPWLDQSSLYATSRVLTTITFTVPVVALIAGAVVRWRYRAYCVTLIVAGTIIGVGAWPYDDPSPIGRLFKDGALGSALGLALRNTPRVVPIIVLGVAGLIAAGVSALAFRPRVEFAVAGAVAVIAIGALWPVWRTGYLSDRVDRDESIPAYWDAAAKAAGKEGDRTRILEIPGSPFAAYRWGNTIEPVTTGLTDRPVLARELLPYGSPESVNLLAALDRRMQNNTFEPDSLARVARFLGVGTVLVRSDLEFERYDTPRPKVLWAELTEPRAAGLGAPKGFGPAVENRSQLPDDQGRANDPKVADPPPVALFAVQDARPIVGSASANQPVVVAGDGDGIVDSAAAGLLDGRELVLYATALDRAELQDALKRGASLVVTDSNRSRARRWDTLGDEVGYTERRGQKPLVEDTEDHRVDRIPGTTAADRTVVEQRGARVDATAYGEPGRYRPEDRPANAFDGDPSTAWRVALRTDIDDVRLVVRPDHPVRADHISLLQSDLPNDAVIQTVDVRVNGGDPIRMQLDISSRVGTGQRIDFPSQAVHKLEVAVIATSLGSPTGGAIAEVGLGGLKVDQLVRVPTRLLTRAGSAQADHPVVIEMTRLRGDPDTGTQGEEPTLQRVFDLPEARAFTVSGTVRSHASAPASTSSSCRDDLLTIDGAPVAVRPILSGDARDGTAVESCNGPLELGAGEHIVRGTPGSVSGVDLDRLVLTSQPAGAVTTSAPSTPPKVTVLDQGSTSFDLKVHTDGKPFWLVLGQSHNDGWHAETGADDDLGEPQVVNGYANGWLVHPDKAGTMTIRLRWTPQRLVWIGLVVSAVVILGCVVLIWRTRRRVAAVALAAEATLTDPRDYPAPPVPVGVSLAVAAAVLVFGTVVSRPWIGAVAAAASFVASKFRGTRLVLVAAVPLALAVGAILDAPELGWLTVVLLSADLVVGWVRARRYSR